jgi:hypothetical protein
VPTPRPGFTRPSHTAGGSVHEVPWGKGVDTGGVVCYGRDRAGERDASARWTGEKGLPAEGGDKASRSHSPPLPTHPFPTLQASCPLPHTPGRCRHAETRGLAGAHAALATPPSPLLPTWSVSISLKVLACGSAGSALSARMVTDISVSSPIAPGVSSPPLYRPCAAAPRSALSCMDADRSCRGRGRGRGWVGEGGVST